MQDPLPKGRTAHGGPGLPIVRQCPTDLPPGQSGGDYSSSKVPSSQLTLICVKLAKSHVHSLRTLLRVGARALALQKLEQVIDGERSSGLCFFRELENNRKIGHYNMPP